MPDTVTFSGTMRDPAGFDDLVSTLGVTPDREVVVHLGSRRLLGVEWWGQRHRFRAVVQGSMPTVDNASRPYQAQFHITSPVTVERSEWWRRLGYTVLRRW